MLQYLHNALSGSRCVPRASALRRTSYSYYLWNGAYTRYFQWQLETFPAIRTGDFITGSRTVCSLHGGTRTGVLIQTAMFSTTNQVIFTTLWWERNRKFNLNKRSWVVNKCAELREVLKCSYTPTSAGWVINRTNTWYNDNDSSWHQSKQLHTHNSHV